MKITCLMATYGRKQALLNNSIACFLSQEHQDKTLLIIDDLGTLEQCVVDAPNVQVLSTRTRSSSLGEKYNTGIMTSHQADAYVVWDDDDVYLPKHLTNHAEILNAYSWSKPSTIITAYVQPPVQESAAGRFHGTIAVSRQLARYIPWEDTRNAAFDMDHIGKLHKFCQPGDPCTIGSPTYIYRWQTANCQHSSGRIHEDDYFKYQPESKEPILKLWAEFDDDTRRLYEAFNT